MNESEITSRCDDEIEIADILLLIWKRKVWIIVFPIISMFVALWILTEQKEEKVYISSIIFEPMTIQTEDMNKEDSIDSLDTINKIIRSDYLKEDLKRYLLDKGTLGPEYFAFVVNAYKITNQIQVSLKSPDPQVGNNTLLALLVILNKYYQPVLDDNIKKKGKKIDLLDKKIMDLNSEIRSALAKANYKKERIKEKISLKKILKLIMQEKFEQIQLNTVRINEKILEVSKKCDNLMSLKATQEERFIKNTNNLSMLMILLNSCKGRLEVFQDALCKLTIIKNENEIEMAQNDSQISQLKLDLSEIENTFYSKNKRWNQEKKDLEVKRELLQQKIRSADGFFKLLKNPSAESSNLRHNITKIMIIVFILALFFSVVAVFFIEYLRFYRNKMSKL